MPRTYSQDLRDRILAADDSGMETAQIARVFNVSRSWVRRVKQRRREFGETTPRARGSGAEIKVDRVQLAALVQHDPDATLLELRDRLGVRCAISTISAALKGLRLTFKKRRSTRPSRIGRMSWNGASSGERGVTALRSSG